MIKFDIINWVSDTGIHTPVAVVGHDGEESYARQRPWTDFFEVSAELPSRLGPTDVYQATRFVCSKITSGWDITDPEISDFMDNACLSAAQLAPAEGSLKEEVERAYYIYVARDIL